MKFLSNLHSFFHPVYGAKNARENKDLMLPWLCAFRQWELNAPMVKASFCQIKSLIDIMPKEQIIALD